jgi:hypothetical protein
LAADGNLDNKVDTDDYSYWRLRFSQAAGRGSSVGLSNPVPEPNVFLLLPIFAGACLCLWRVPRPFFG